MHFDERRLDELEKELDREVSDGARVYMTYPNVVKNLIADLREWQQIAKDNADALHLIEKSIAHT
jgi:hypothetical protein